MEKPQVQLYNFDYGKYSTNRIDKNQLNHHFKDNYPNNASFIKQELNAQIKDIAYQLLGKPNVQKTTEWRYGNQGSISIHVAGTKQGLYSNFETGESGNALKLIADYLSLDHKQAFKWGVGWLGYDRNPGLTGPMADKAAVIKDQPLPQAKQEWTPTFPAPSTHVDLHDKPNLAYMLKGHQEISRYAYKDADSNILGYVVRLEDKQGNKITPILTYCQNDRGEKQWRWQGFGHDRPLYGLEQLKQKPDAPVMIVEGEKTAEAAKALFPDHAVVTWSGGCGAVNKSDWSVLTSREVTIWPDNDKAGINAAAKISDILKEQGNETVKILDLPSTLPQKWDLADKLPDGMDIKEILNNHSQALTKQETLKDLPEQLIHNGKIAQIIYQHKLDVTFDSLNNSDYQHVHKVFDILKESYQTANIKTEDDWVLKRATFMVYNLREFSNLPMTDNERARACLVAATIFANQNERTDAAATYDNHFKAMGVINTHNQSRDQYIQAEHSFKELFGFQPNAPFEVRQNYVNALQDKLFTQIKQLDLHYQQRNLEIATKALDMQKGKGLEL